MLLFGYFHKSRLLYGLPAFIEQKSYINRIDKIMVKNIKKLLKLPNRTNNERLKISLGLSDLNIVGRLLKLKVKYQKKYNEKLAMYDIVIKNILNIKNIPPKLNINYYITKKIKSLGISKGITINDKFTKRLKKRIYSWYVEGDFLLLKFMFHIFFRVDINKKCILCKTENISINHVVNVCKELEKKRNDLINQINKFDKNIKNKTKYWIFLL